jgi:hypothetical protein
MLKKKMKFNCIATKEERKKIQKAPVQNVVLGSIKARDYV